MESNQAGFAPALSSFAQRLSHRATLVANARPGYATAPHEHDCDMLFLPVAGRFELVDARQQRWRSSPGHFIWFAAGAAHATAALTLKQSHVAVYVDPDFWGTALRANGVERPAQGMRCGSAALAALLGALLELAGDAAQAHAAHCGALVMEAARLSANPLQHDLGEASRAIADLLADDIRADLSRPLALADFAVRHRLSRRQVERMFRSQTGSSPLEFQRARRTERACYLLQTTDDSVLSIAQQVGWESGSYLSRVLGRACAASAAEIRAVGRQRPRPDRSGRP